MKYIARYMKLKLTFGSNTKKIASNIVQRCVYSKTNILTTICDKLYVFEVKKKFIVIKQ